MRREDHINQNRCLVLLVAVYLLAGLLVAMPVSLAQTPAEMPTAPELMEKQTILLGILRSILLLEGELKGKQAELRSPAAAGRQEEVIQQIKKIGDKLGSLRENLNEVASGVDLAVFSKKEDMDLDWKKKVLDFLGPVINELTRLTARPREIERLRTAVAKYQEQLRLAEKALGNIDKLAEQHLDAALAPHLRLLQKDWKVRQQDFSTQLSIATQQLEQKLGEQQTLSESVKNIFQLFFRSRGRNFLLACLAFASFWLFFHRLQSWIQGTGLLRGKGRTSSVRLFNVGYTVFKVFGATLSFLLVLYLFEDWVLLTLSSLFLLGIAWTSKHTLPRFLHEAMLLLNAGAVREGERVLYNGVPWMVQSLNFYTRMVNPELVGGDIRLPLRDFTELRSRPFEPGEPVFPTRIGDWVLIDGQTLGKVVLQTPDIVRIVLLGGSRRTFRTPDFLAQSPTVLSTGFRLDVHFGIDYQHQAVITREIPAQLESRLREDLAREGYEKEIVNLKVEFEEAGTSSLNLRVMADFSGAAAPGYQALGRAIQRISVNACNDHGWVIPFAQLTLHMAAASGKASPPDLEGSPGDGEPGMGER